jgi:hypothetical protein
LWRGRSKEATGLPFLALLVVGVDAEDEIECRGRAGKNNEYSERERRKSKKRVKAVARIDTSVRFRASRILQDLLGWMP